MVQINGFFGHLAPQEIMQLRELAGYYRGTLIKVTDTSIWIEPKKDFHQNGLLISLGSMGLYSGNND